MSNTVDIKINKPTKRYPVEGQIVTTAVDKYGVIKNQFLRRRVKDSAIDDCVEIVKAAKPAAKKPTKPTEDE